MKKILMKLALAILVVDIKADPLNPNERDTLLKTAMIIALKDPIHLKNFNEFIQRNICEGANLLESAQTLNFLKRISATMEGKGMETEIVARIQKNDCEQLSMFLESAGKVYVDRLCEMYDITIEGKLFELQRLGKSFDKDALLELYSESQKSLLPPVCEPAMEKMRLAILEYMDKKIAELEKNLPQPKVATTPLPTETPENPEK